MAVPTTWNEAVHQTANDVLAYAALGSDVEDVVADVQHLKNAAFGPADLTNYRIVGDDYRDLAVDMLAYWWNAIGSATPFSEWAAAKLTAGADLAISKQHDYGHDNILAFGHQGIVVRIHDKWARIQNLQAKGASPSNESLEDSFADIVNYCVIGIMLVDGTFTLELAE